MKKNIYTVGQINAYITNMFAQDYMLRSVTVSGEVSNITYHSSGHIFFTMKDKSGILSCIMYARYGHSMTFRMTEGMQIEATGSIGVYEAAGKYQLYATQISLAGAGVLYEKYEKLKAELEEKGMFSPLYKKPIPKYAMRIGVVTSPTGAAVQDIIQIAGRRNPYVQLILYPALVQGEGAKESIVAGIQSLENQNVDVIIVGRGGGSIEELWAFNEECVAQAIFDCSVPIVSAVGHQTDTTIADWVADLRAPTPSAAAELTVFSYEEFVGHLNEIEYKLNVAVANKINRKRERVNQLGLRLNALSPDTKVRLQRMKYMNMLQQLDGLMEDKLNSCRHRLMLYIGKMKGLSPLTRLEQGYASVSMPDGRKVTDIEDVSVGDEVMLRMRSGKIKTRVQEVLEEKYE